MKTPFDSLFDFNHDGKIEGFERIARDGLIMKITTEMAQNDSHVEAGIDPDEFACMSESEKAEALEDAGLDADDFDL